ncbi:hypothetical protein AB0I89_24065 [Micromonospora sp. NPDC049801]|uniref:hypothetical protein n=1 Tax=unclassified Micromonospora TaxID=2617518 RepID=UPI003400ECAC
MTAPQRPDPAEVNRKAAAVFGAMAAGASGRRSTYDRRDGTWTTEHGRDNTGGSGRT